jgi:hypothetical protein
MAWYLFVRTLFVLAVAYAAFLTRPFSDHPVISLLAGVVLGLLTIAAEARLRDAEVTDLLGALIGGAVGLGRTRASSSCTVSCCWCSRISASSSARARANG